MRLTPAVLALAILGGFGAAFASPKRLCAPDYLDPADVEFIYNFSDDPRSHLPAGLTTTEDRTVSCQTNDTSPCVVGHQAGIFQVSPPQVPLLPIAIVQPCKNFIIACGTQQDLTFTYSWGKLPPGDYEYRYNWQSYGCDPNSPVNLSGSDEFTVPAG